MSRQGGTPVLTAPSLGSACVLYEALEFSSEDARMQMMRAFCVACIAVGLVDYLIFGGKYSFAARKMISQIVFQLF
jgi:hypothetical protein